MAQNAAAMGANAVTMMRFDSTEMSAGMTEIVAYHRPGDQAGRDVLRPDERAELRRLP